VDPYVRPCSFQGTSLLRLLRLVADCPQGHRNVDVGPLASPLCVFSLFLFFPTPRPWFSHGQTGLLTLSGESRPFSPLLILVLLFHRFEDCFLPLRGRFSAVEGGNPHIYHFPLLSLFPQVTNRPLLPALTLPPRPGLSKYGCLQASPAGFARAARLRELLC